MNWLFGHKKQQRYEHVTHLDEEARTGEVTLISKIMELDRKRVDLDRLTAEALKDLGRPHRV